MLCMTFNNIALTMPYTQSDLFWQMPCLWKSLKMLDIRGGAGGFELMEPKLMILLVHCTGVGSKNVQSKAKGVTTTDSLPMDTALLHVNVSDTTDMNKKYEVLGISSNCHKVES